MKRFGIPDIAAISVAVIWGSNLSIVKHALTEFHPMTFNAIRMAIASVFLWTLTRLIDGPIRVRKEDWRKLILLGVIGNTSYQLLFISGMTLAKAGNAALLLLTATVLIAILGRITGREIPDWGMWKGIFVSMAGIAIILLESSQLNLSRANFKGDLLILGGTACWAVLTVYSQNVMKNYTPLSFTTVTLAIGTGMFILAALPYVPAQDWESISLLAWTELTFSAFLALGIAYVFFFYGVSHLGGTKASLYTNLTPFLGLLVAWMVLGEPLTLLQGLGGLLIIYGIFNTRRRQTT